MMGVGVVTAIGSGDIVPSGRYASTSSQLRGGSFSFPGDTHGVGVKRRTGRPGTTYSYDSGTPSCPFTVATTSTFPMPSAPMGDAGVRSFTVRPLSVTVTALAWVTLLPLRNTTLVTPAAKPRPFKVTS